MITEVESAVISGMLTCQEKAKEGISRLKKYSFVDGQLQTIFKEIASQLDAKGSFDSLLVKAKCSGRVDDETWYLIEEFDGDSPEFREYLTTLADSAKKQELRKIFLKGLESLDSVEPEAVSASVLETLQRSEASSSKSGKHTHSMKDMVNGFLKKFRERVASDNPITGVATGFDDLDEMTTGFGHTDLIIVAGRPAMGKTTFALNIVENVLKRGGRALLFSLEMSNDQITQKLISSQGSINYKNLKTGKLTSLEVHRFEETLLRIKNGYDFICEDEAGLTFSEIRRRILKHHREHPLSVVMIDYLQLINMGGSDANRSAQIAVITTGLKSLAKEINAPIILLSQLNRELEKRMDKRPVNADLRESGAIEQDADMIMFVYRDEVYYPESEHKGKAEIIIGKQRSGPIGTVITGFEGEYSRFNNIKKGDVSQEFHPF